jgi:hypothetical protein
MKSKKTVTVILDPEQIDLISNGLNDADNKLVEDIIVQIEYDASVREVKSIDIVGSCVQQYVNTIYKASK